MFWKLKKWLESILLWDPFGRKEEKQRQKDLRIARVEIFAKKMIRGLYDDEDLNTVDVRCFGYENAYEMWKELSDNIDHLLYYFDPYTQHSVRLNKDVVKQIKVVKELEVVKQKELSS